MGILIQSHVVVFVQPLERIRGRDCIAQEEFGEGVIFT